jgi:hypothetical protein
MLRLTLLNEVIVDLEIVVVDAKEPLTYKYAIVFVPEAPTLEVTNPT